MTASLSAMTPVYPKLISLPSSVLAALSVSIIDRSTRHIRGNCLHVDTGMFLVRIELEPVSTEYDLAFELGLKSLDGFNGAGGSFLHLC